LHPQEKVARYRRLGWWGEETIDELLRATVERHSGSLAVVDPPDKHALCDLPGHRLTWSEVDSSVDALAATLLRRGIGVGDVVGVQLPNIVELVITYLAVIRIGGIVSPLNTQYRDRELATAARLAKFDAFVTTTRIEAHAAAAAAGLLTSAVHSIFVFGQRPAHGTDPRPPEHSRREDRFVAVKIRPAEPEDLAFVREHRSAYRADPNHCVTICWTSGTESAPKAVPRCHYDWLAISAVTQEAPGLSGDDVILNPFPMVNMAAIAGTLLPWLRLGARYALHHPFTLSTFLTQIAEEGVTYTVAPPAVLTMLLGREDLLRQTDLSSVRSIASGASPLPPSMVAGWQERFGINVINMFGSNEGACLLSAPADFPDPRQRATYFPRFGAPGVTWSCRSMDRVTIKLVDTTTGDEITEPGGRGEMRIAGPTVFAGYLAGTGTDPFDEQGFLRSGDVFELAGDQGQYLRYVDRARDLIIRGGINISPAEVESLLSRHPAVAEVAVVGIADEVLGERACAAVVAAPGERVTSEELLEHLRALRIAPFKMPERFAFVDSLPRNSLGKILKHRLRAQLSTSTTE
jgi:acyl-CoA synthetase (AMP-forming)/AMP-acid ligase II